MAEVEDLAALIAAVRAGDRAAEDRLATLCTPIVREKVEPIVRGARIGGDMSLGDVTQVVLLKVVNGVKSPTFQLDPEAGLAGYIVTVATNHVNDIIRDRKAKKRGGGRTPVPIGPTDPLASAPGGVDPASPRIGPATLAGRKDLVEAALRLFTKGERRLVELAAHGRSWAEIAAELGTTPDAARMRHDRAVKRVAKELGLPPDIAI